MSSIQATPTSVYRYFDSRGLLLYVGVTSRGTTRNVEHNKSKSWWPYVTRQDVEHFSTRPEALAREADLIRSFHPPFNVQHNPNHAAAQQAYLDLLSEPPTQAGRRLEFLPWRADEDGFNTVLRSRPVDWAGLVEAMPGVRANANRKLGLVTIEKHGPFLIARLTGRTPLVLSAVAGIRFDLNSKPAVLRVRSLVLKLDRPP